MSTTAIIWIIVGVLAVLVLAGVVAIVLTHRSHQRLQPKIARAQRMRLIPPDTMQRYAWVEKRLGPEMVDAATEVELHRMFSK